MKKLFVIVALSLICSYGYTQTVKEWVQQKKTQIEYLVNQIVGLRAYAGVINKGYQTAKDGLGVIRGIKEGDFSLHEDRFQKLEKVSPVVQSSPAFKIIALQWLDIQTTATKISKLCQLEGGLTQDEKIYVLDVVKNLQKICRATLDDLALTSQSGYLALSDDERLNRISEMQKEIADAHRFIRAFEKRLQLLALSRLKESKDGKVLKKLYGIK